MRNVSESTRWWENYLVRYFMPCVAGMVIIRWLDRNTGGSISNYVPVFLLKNVKDFGTAHLIVWLLFGSLYCYIASFPILVFHATRVLDFKDGNGTLDWKGLASYLCVFIFTLLACTIALFNCVWLAFIIVFAFFFIQISRLWDAYSLKESSGFRCGYKGTSIAYAYLNQLSKRRSVKKETGALDDDELGRVNRDHSRLADLQESYKHLRENGNAAFIFLLELALSPILLVALNNPTFVFPCTTYTVYTVPLILIFWIFPSVLVYLLGQHLERRYSLFYSAIDNSILAWFKRCFCKIICCVLFFLLILCLLGLLTICAV